MVPESPLLTWAANARLTEAVLGSDRLVLLQSPETIEEMYNILLMTMKLLLNFVQQADGCPIDLCTSVHRNPKIIMDH